MPVNKGINHKNILEQLVLFSSCNTVQCLKGLQLIIWVNFFVSSHFGIRNYVPEIH